MTGHKSQMSFWTKMISIWVTTITILGTISGVMWKLPEIKKFIDRVSIVWEAAPHLEHIDELMHRGEGVEDSLLALFKVRDLRLDSMEEAHLMIIMGKYPFDTLWYRDRFGGWHYKTIQDFLH